MKIATAHTFFSNALRLYLVSTNTTLTMYFHDLITRISNITDLNFYRLFLFDLPQFKEK